MAGRSLTDRVEILEQKVEGLQTLPAKLAALTENVSGLRMEFSQFRGENDVAHFAIRDEIGQMHQLAIKQALDFHDETLKRFDQVDERFDKIDQKFDRIDEKFAKIDATLDIILSRLPRP